MVSISGDAITSVDNKLPAAANISAMVDANRPGTTAFLSQLTTGASAVQASANQACVMGAWIQALSTNTASIFVGGSDVSATKGLELTPGSSDFFSTGNLNTLYVHSASTGQKVNIRYI